MVRSPHIERDGCSLPVDQAAATTSLVGLSQGTLAAQPLQPPLVPSRDAEAYYASLPLLIDTSWVNTDQDGICHGICVRVRLSFTYVMLPWMCWVLLFNGVFHGLWNMSFGETAALMILAMIATSCCFGLQTMCQTLFPTCWAKVEVFGNWMMMPCVIFSLWCAPCWLGGFFLKFFWETYCVKSVEIEAVEGDHRGPDAVTDAV